MRAEVMVMAKKRPGVNIMVDAVRALKQEKEAKGRRTLFLRNEPFERLQSYCEEQGLSVSALIDRWISEFLDSVKK